MTKVKVCCISSTDEARLALECGADALGLVSEMPGGPGVISEAEIAAIIADLPHEVNTFLLSCKQSFEELSAQIKKIKPKTLQMVDFVKPSVAKELKSTFPDLNLVQVIHVQGEESLDEALQASEHVDFILLDSGNPNLKVKTLGGTGNTHNWEFSKRIVELLKIPVFLAGGLKPENATQAIKTVRPYGLDLCSGVRIGEKLSEEKLRAFFEAVRNTKI